MKVRPARSITALPVPLATTSSVHDEKYRAALRSNSPPSATVTVSSSAHTTTRSGEPDESGITAPDDYVIGRPVGTSRTVSTRDRADDPFSRLGPIAHGAHAATDADPARTWLLEASAPGELAVTDLSVMAQGPGGAGAMPASPIASRNLEADCPGGPAPGRRRAPFGTGESAGVAAGL